MVKSSRIFNDFIEKNQIPLISMRKKLAQLTKEEKELQGLVDLAEIESIKRKHND